ncbi:ABC transporter ATP-binding protein [Deinococcus deserti]|uniref:Putative ABC-type multidrug transport system, ATPase and permease components n=1 Tax=Deinococcus deserti (strain DSM 17065 / CIP 109153 / LMG 22923 / VCD115) TaxID=546414 RepID=C1CXN8_DEIDV|nr:ABC transporter ATP-binding protein [Deinococcus deserti]ACO44844.2 putative ABC-type multidrug transport system, ATPase and permease components [Deinococcus deserti VCD115]
MPEAPSVTRRLYGLLTPYRRRVALGLTLLLGSVAAELYPPLVWIRVVDQGLPARDWTFIGTQLALLVVVFGVQQLLSAWRGLILERAGQQLTLDVRLAVYRKLQSQSAAYFESQRTGDLIARVTGDVDALQDVLVRGTDSVIANLLRLIGVIGIFIALQPTLGVLTTLPMLAVGLMLWRYGKSVRPAYRAARSRLGDLTALITDRLSGVRVVQGFAREQAESARVEALGQALYAEQVRAVALRNRAFPLARFVGNLGNVIMLGGGAWLIMAGQFTLGGLLAYRGYGRYFYGPIDDLVNIGDLLQRAEAAGRRVFEVLDAPVDIVERPDARELPSPAHGEVRFENVTFGYSPARPVLRDVSFHVPAGQRVAVLGESGAGKSTLLGLVTRAHDPHSGRVILDGVDVRDLTLRSLRTGAVTMPQDTFLFHDTVRANVTYARPEAAPEEIEAALRAAHALDFVRALPEGLETMVGERGVKLSGGQRQRLAIARTLLARPALLLLDEPTSAVDAESEALVVAALDRLMQGRTSLIVTHRLSLARGADRVLVFRDGRLIEDGPPAQLRLRGGAYAALERAAEALERGEVVSLSEV